MRHSFIASDLILLFWIAFLLWRILPGLLARRKSDRRELLAATWPSFPGRVHDASVKMVDMRWRLILTYDAFATGHGIDLWHRDFLSKPEAEHAAHVLAGTPCSVYVNPARTDDTTLLWSEINARLAQDPYVPQIIRLRRNGYRWLVVYAAFAVAGLSASVVLFGIAMSGSSACVCTAIATLMTAAPFFLLLSLVPMGRMMIVALRSNMLQRLLSVLPGWRRYAMGLTLLAAIACLAHYGPIFRALPTDADVPDKVFAGTFGAMIIPMYLFSVLIAIEALNRLRPAEDRVRIPAF